VSCIEVSFYNFCAFFAHKFGVTDAWWGVSISLDVSLTPFNPLNAY
jgi:hypothetical protein